MATQVQVSGATTIPGMPKPSGSQSDAATPGAFEALLGGTGQQSGTTAAAESGADLGPGNLVNLSFGAGFGEDGQQTEDPNAIAAAIDVAIPFQTQPLPVLNDLVASLADLKARIDAGQPLDAETLKGIDAALKSLAEAFNIDLNDLPSVDELAALASTPLPEGSDLDAQLTQALAPLAQTLLGGSVTKDVELSGLVKSIGDKLAALLQSLNAGGLDPDKLAALGLDAGATADADLQAAIAKLVAPAVPVDASAAAPALATPTLKLVEPVLSGKADADASTAVETAGTSAKVTVETDRDASADTSSGSDDKKPRETKAAIAIATAPEKLPDNQLAGQTTQQVSRIDAAAAPRVVQTGYQTSQQQLNLPQIAFELVRQVNDGNTRFQMRLDPPELGRIDVKLDIDATGQVNARLTVEKAETLDLMQRDQRGLEKALQQAGLDSAKTNLEFSLKQNPGGNQQGQDGNGRTPLFGGDVVADADEAPLPTVNLYRGSLTASGVNIIA